jgi:hypothetical protein
MGLMPIAFLDCEFKMSVTLERCVVIISWNYRPASMAVCQKQIHGTVASCYSSYGHHVWLEHHQRIMDPENQRQGFHNVLDSPPSSYRTQCIARNVRQLLRMENLEPARGRYFRYDNRHYSKSLYKPSVSCRVSGTCTGHRRQLLCHFEQTFVLFINLITSLDFLKYIYHYLRVYNYTALLKC